MRRRYSSPSNSEGGLFPVVLSDLDWRLNFSPSKVGSVYEGTKLINPNSRSHFSLPFKGVSFFSGVDTKVFNSATGMVYFAPSINDQGVKGLILSPLSPESGEVTPLPSKVNLLRPYTNSTTEVMNGYT